MIRRTIEAAPKALLTDGGLFLEIWPDHGPAVARLARDHGFLEVEVVKDLAGRDRVAVLTGLQ